MLHPGPLIASGIVDIAVEAGAAASIDDVAAEAAPALGFLRAAWFAAGTQDLTTLVARRPATGRAIAALPLARRKLGPLTVRQMAGHYWPYRSVPLALDIADDELDALLGSPEALAALGRAWRIGPVLSDDPAATRLESAARRCGWHVLRRSLGTYFIVDLERLVADGPWPSSKTLQRNRRHERRLAETGPLDFRHVSGAEWDGSVFDMLAAIETESWVARAKDGDPKFIEPADRRAWEHAVSDPEIAARLGASFLTIGGAPVAFNFTLRAGDILHVIANSYSQRFADRSPGRVLLYREFQRAVANGVARIGWGAGDPGYKHEMGATPGAGIEDLMFVRGAVLAKLARLAWR